MNHDIACSLKSFQWEPISNGFATFWQDTTHRVTDRDGLDRIIEFLEKLEDTWSDGRGRGERNEVLHTPFLDEPTFVKQYHHGGLLAGEEDVHYDSPERFLSELRASLQAQEVGIHVPTPRAVAYFEDPDGYRGFYLSRFVESSRLSFELRRNQDRESLLEEAGSALAELHDAGIDHQDYHVTNLGVDGYGSLLVTDFDPVRFGDVGRSCRERRVQRFTRSLDKRGFPVDDNDVFRRGYWKESSIECSTMNRVFFGTLNRVKNSLSDTLYNLRNRPLRKEDFERVLVRAPNWLGDTVMSLPFLETLEEQNSDTIVDVAARESVVSIYELHPAVNRVHTLPNEKTWSMPDVSDERYSSMILLPKSLRTGLQAYTSGIPRRIGFATQGRSPFLTDRVPLEGDDRTLHHARLFFKLLGNYLPEPESPQINHFPRRNAFDDIDEPLPETKYLTIHPGSAYGPAKRYPPELFSECLLRLTKKTQFDIVALGVEDEQEFAEAVLEPIDSDRIHDRVGETSLRGAMYLLKNSYGTIANDSGVMHLSAALGTPTLGIFGSSDPSLTSPVGERTDFLYEDVECSPCFERECPLDEDRYKCLRRIDPGRVQERFQKLIEPS